MNDANIETYKYTSNLDASDKVTQVLSVQSAPMWFHI